MNQFLVKISRFLLYLTALTPLVFAGSFYYPYIVPRTIWFRLLVEIVALIWFCLWARGYFRISALKWRKNYFVLILTLLVVVDLIASLFGLSFNNSLFGDIERSWGVYTIFHLYLFYLLLRVFFDSKSWKIYLHCLLTSTLGVAAYGIVQYYPHVFGVSLFQAGPGRILSTLGNPAYTAMTLLFGVGLAIYLLLEAPRKWQRYLYGILIIVLFFAFTLTGIRGASLGFIIGAGTALAFLLFSYRVRRIRIASGVGLLCLLIAGSVVFAFRQTSQVRALPVVGRLASINLNDGTVKTRLISWRASLKGFRDNPVLGVGLENYGAIFNKYFNPIYYSLASSEPYFDRAHNSFLDILATTGAMGFLTFLALIIFLIYYLWHGWCSERLSRSVLALFLGLFTAYFVHIFFVFDDINSLLFFFAWLALVEFDWHKETLFIAASNPFRSFQSARFLVFVVAAIILVWWGLIFNIRIASASLNVINGLLTSDGLQASRLYQEALTLKTIPRVGLVAPYVDWLVKIANEYKKVNTAEAKKLFDDNFAVVKKSLEEELNKNKYNPIIFIKLSTVYSAHFLIYNDETDKDFAIAYIEGAIALSPERPQYYNLLAETYVIFGQGEKAVVAAEKSLSMNRDYIETYVYLIRSYATAGKLDQSFSHYQESLRRGLTANSEDAALDLGGKFIKANQIEKAAEVYRLLLEKKPESAKALVNLTIVSLRMNKLDEAVKYALAAAEIDKSLKSEVDYIVQQIRAGKVKELLEKLGG